MKFIATIVEEKGYHRNILTMLDPYLENTRLCIDKTNKIIEIKYEILGAHPTSEECESAINKIEELEPIIVILSNLLVYLEKEGLVTIYNPVNNGNQTVTIGTGAINRNSIDNQFQDQKISGMLVSFVHKEIIPNQELLQLYSNGFLSEDEIRFKKQQKATWVSIFIAGLIGLGGIAYQVIDKISGKNEENEQIEYFKAEMLNLNRHLKELANKPTPDMNAVTDSLHSIDRTIETALSDGGKVNDLENNQDPKTKQTGSEKGVR